MNYPVASLKGDASLGSALQTNVILRLKAEESLFKSAASCGELDPSD